MNYKLVKEKIVKADSDLVSYEEKGCLSKWSVDIFGFVVLILMIFFILSLFT